MSRGGGSRWRQRVGGRWWWWWWERRVRLKVSVSVSVSQRHQASWPAWRKNRLTGLTAKPTSRLGGDVVRCGGLSLRGASRGTPARIPRCVRWRRQGADDRGIDGWIVVGDIRVLSAEDTRCGEIDASCLRVVAKAVQHVYANRPRRRNLEQHSRGPTSSARSEAYSSFCVWSTSPQRPNAPRCRSQSQKA